MTIYTSTILGATVSENESFSLPSIDEDCIISSMSTTLQGVPTYQANAMESDQQQCYINAKAKDKITNSEIEITKSVFPATHCSVNDSSKPKSFEVDTWKLKNTAPLPKTQETTEQSTLPAGITTLSEDMPMIDVAVAGENHSSLPPPLPAKQVIHLSNSSEILDEISMHYPNHMDEVMEMDIMNISKGNSDLTKSVDKSEIMEVCEDEGSFSTYMPESNKVNPLPVVHLSMDMKNPKTEMVLKKSENT